MTDADGNGDSSSTSYDDSPCQDPSIDGGEPSKINTVEPDAWQKKTDKYFTYPNGNKHKTGRDKSFDNRFEGLYSAETIQEAIEQKKYDLGDSDCGCTRAGRCKFHQILRELKEEFKQKSDEEK